MPKFGDILQPRAQPAPAAGMVSVTEPDVNGVVTWKISNTGGTTGSWILQRGASQAGVPFEDYIFGGAFAPAYLYNAASFGTSLLTAQPTPLSGAGVAPMGIISSPSGTLFAFVFTIAPGQTFTMEEGGFSGGVVPSNPVLVPVTPEASPTTYSVTWQSEQCAGFNSQTGSTLPCPPDPWTITGITLTCTTDVPILAPDTFTVVSTGTPTPPPDTCTQLLLAAEAEVGQGNILAAVEDVLAFLWCQVDAGNLSMGSLLKAVVEEARKRR